MGESEPLLSNPDYHATNAVRYHRTVTFTGDATAHHHQSHSHVHGHTHSHSSSGNGNGSGHAAAGQADLNRGLSINNHSQDAPLDAARQHATYKANPGRQAGPRASQARGLEAFDSDDDDDDDGNTNSPREYHRKRRVVAPFQPSLTADLLAETLGTFVMVLFALGSVAHLVVGTSNPLAVHIGNGLGVCIGVMVSHGGHLNASVTLALAVFKGFPWRKVPLFILAQFVGSFLAAALVYAIYYDGIEEFDGGSRHVTGTKATAGIFATYLAPGVSIGEGFADQILATALLLMGLFSITDEQNPSVGKHGLPPSAGVLVTAIGISFGFNCGYPLNPMRDFGPRLFTYMAGWGGEVFTAGDSWSWVPLVAPPLGGLLGSAMYQLMIERPRRR
ncbi:aquaporin 10 [Capsaspora owczarzaki ATCC 30864]|uniref:Aquaporin 10 n=2 Tax=Capsaspora owczarzaki (strain ATCC 30864) TaxID=595528 RepID=A0A0D2WY68_CAPO3|nr:aquaporin 10 [Capsaspora owczarzaki ATCC 30864]